MNGCIREHRLARAKTFPTAAMNGRWWAGLLLSLFSFLYPTTVCLAEAPLVVDDPHTIGSGNVELIIAVSSLEQAGTINTEAPVIDLDIGLMDRLDLILVGSPAHTSQATQALPIEGQIAASLKWQFLKSDRWNASLNPGIESNLRSGRRNSIILPLQIEYSKGRFAWGFEGDYLIVLDNTDQWLAGTYASLQYGDDLLLLAEFWALGVRNNYQTDLGVTGGLIWRTPFGPSLLASLGTGVASFGIKRIEWRIYFGVQWNFRLWGKSLTDDIPIGE